MYLMCKGALRGFAKDGTKGITSWIIVENEMVTSISSFFVQLPLFENIQAIEKCEMKGLSYEHLEIIYNPFPEMNIVGKNY